MLAGKKGIIFGIANDHSIAWGIAEKLHQHGANLAITYQNNTLLKRVKPNIVSEEATYLDLKIDRESMKVFRKEKEITLGPKEYKLLDFLIKQPKRVYSREQLLEHVWGDDINVESRTVDVHITRLRQSINIEGAKPLIRTVRSAGYSLEN